MLVFLILYNESVPFAQKSQSRGKFGDLAIFVFVFAVFSKYFAGRLTCVWTSYVGRKD